MITIIKPTYVSYRNRVYQPFVRSMPFIILVILISILMGSQIWISVAIPSVFLFFYLAVFLKITRNYLVSVTIDKNQNTFILKQNRGDKIFKESTHSLNDIDVRIKEIQVMYKSYELEIYLNRKLLLKQKTVGGWNTKYFREIVQTINDIKGKPSHLNYMRD